MCRDFSISPFVRRKRRDRLALQSSFLPNDQAVKICQKQRMFLALVDGICTAYLQTGGPGEALRHIILQITTLPHGLIVDILNGIADFIVVNLKCRAIGIQAKDNEYTVHQLNNGMHYYTGTLEWWENYWENPTSGEKNNNTAGQLELQDLSWDHYNYVEENFSDNATALFGTKGVQLVMDGAKVTGVIAQDSDGNYLKINAKNGVVLAGGGFGGNKEMMDDLLPDIKRLFTKDEDFFAPFGRDGSTIQMGVWAGGRLEGDISTMNFDSMAVPDYLPGPLWVDENGQRFQNEAFAGPEINGFFMARAKRGNITSIYDSTYETQILRGFPGHQAFEYDMPAVVEAMKGNFEAAKAAGAEGANGWYCADTIEQLAEYIGVEPAALSATVEQYNKVRAEGYDSDFAKDPHFLNAVAKAPFYAHVTTPSLGFALVTTGGFVTTNDQQVLNEDYQPIEGLYASGNTCGMRFGPEYITPIPGVSIGMCLTLGRELGKYLAAK